jgi:hypothetical protein
MNFMERDGFLVVRDAVSIPEQLFEKIRYSLKKSGTIFNDNDQECQDHLRKMASISLSPKDLPGFEKLIQFVAPSSVNLEWVVLESLAGCHRQAAHVDYIFDKRNSRRVKELSYGCLLAVQDGTKLDVWPAAHRLFVRDHSHDHSTIERCTISLSKGDAVLFRADCVHAGSAYEDYNVRLHCYIDTDDMPHTTNRVGRVNTLGFKEGALSST